MPTCPSCGVTVREGIAYCGNCGAAIDSPAKSISASQPELTLQGTSDMPKTLSNSDLTARLEKATRRAELLGYAAAGLGVAILFVLIVISLL